MIREQILEIPRDIVRFRSSKACSWMAIFSLIFSSALTLTHHHGGEECGCGSHPHSTSAIAGLESLPTGHCNCDCTDSELPAPSHNNQNEHDEDTCSICRMVFEHAVQTIEFDLFESNEPSCDTVAILLVAQIQSADFSYQSRGPPASLA